MFPALLATEIALLVVAAAGGWLGPKLRANADIGRALPRLLRERRVVQATATVDAATFADCLTAELDSEFLGAAATIPPAPRPAARLLVARAPPALGDRGDRVGLERDLEHLVDA